MSKRESGFASIMVLMLASALLVVSAVALSAMYRGFDANRSFRERIRIKAENIGKEKSATHIDKL